MSVLKLQRAMLCKYCKHVGCFSQIIELQGMPALRNRTALLYITRAHSAFTKHVAPAASFATSSIVTKSYHFKPRSWLWSSPNPVLTEHYLFCLPGSSCVVMPQRAYSISPQPQQKRENPQGWDTGGKPQDVMPTEFRQNPTQSMVESNEKGDEDEGDNEPRGLVARFKDAYKNYGKVLVVVHCITSAAWFSTFYYAAYTGIDVVPFLKWVGVSERFISPFQSSGVGNLAVAYLLYKLATPARYPVTIMGTRYTVRYMRATGLMPPVPEGSRIRDFVKESRVQVREKYEDLKDEVREKGEEIKDKMEERRDVFKDKMEEKRDEIKEKMEEKRDELKEKMEDKRDELKEKMEDKRDELKEKMEDKRDSLKDKAGELKNRLNKPR